jgi:N-acetylglucosaminyl-diphospho-decaprenol L-rhamnosyltransferase
VDFFEIGSITIVDNASSDDSLSGLPSIHHRIILDKVEENMGFARGCNRGARAGRGDYILFLNPDVSLSNTSLSRCISFMEDPLNKAVGICGIRLLDEMRKPSVCAAHFPTLGNFASKALGLNKLLPKAFATHLLPAGEPIESCVVDQVIGAFFLVRRRLFELCGGFDERFFMYFEEVDFSLRARSLGYLSYVLTDVQAFHKGGGSSDQIKALRMAYSWRSRLAYGKKHFPYFQRALLAAITGIVEPTARLLSSLITGRLQEFVDTTKAWRFLVLGFPKS